MPRLHLIPAWSTALTLMIAGLSGCSVYHRLPLTGDAVAAKLRPPGDAELAVAVGEIKHPLLHPVRLDARDGLSADEAAVLAVVLNPNLRAARDRRDEAQAQLLQAGILPNPQLSGSLDFVTGGNTLDTQTGVGYGLSWDLRSLLAHGPEVTAAKEAAASVHLDIAWQEWQTALAAESALYDLAALNAQVAKAGEITDRLDENAKLVAKAAAAHEQTILDSAAAESSANDARAILLELRQERAQRRIALNRAIGYPPATKLKVQSDVALPSHIDAPAESTLLAGLEERRLDLLALKRGYDSEDAKLRAAIIAQFPNISIGLDRAADTSNVKSVGPGATIDLPLFDRNQGNVAIGRATRQRLLDEYSSRVFEAHSDIAAALADIDSLDAQIAEARRALPALARLVEVSKEALEQGNTDVIGYYTARNDLTRKSLDILKLQQRLAASRVALETAAAWHLSP